MSCAVDPMHKLRFLLKPLEWLLALVILFEEWGWEPLQRWLTRMGQWPGLRWIEGRVQMLPPYAALALFGVPALLLLPVKLLALWLIGRGHTVSGLLIIIGAKVVGTAVVARLFALTQPALMRLAWFASVYSRWTAWKNQLLTQVRASFVWRTARISRRRLQQAWARFRAG